MTEHQDSEESSLFKVDHAKTSRSSCKKCKEKLEKGTLRLGKWGFNHFSSNYSYFWYHVPCLYQIFQKQRKTTSRITTCNDIDGWEQLSDEDKQIILQELTSEELATFNAGIVSTKQTTPSIENKVSPNGKIVPTKDELFKTFRKICAELCEISNPKEQTKLLKKFFENGLNGTGFSSDKYLWCRLLIPSSSRQTDFISIKTVIKIFSDLFKKEINYNDDDDIADIVAKTFEDSGIPPTKKSLLTLKDVDTFLDNLWKEKNVTKQTDLAKKITLKCTVNDFRMVVRLILQDLGINCGPKEILDAIDGDAHNRFLSTKELGNVFNITRKRKLTGSGENEKKIKPVKKNTNPIKMIMSKPLSDPFSGNILFLPSDLEDRDKLRRYIIALGGRIFSQNKNSTVESNFGQVTHLVATKSVTTYKTAQPVTSDWIWKKIKDNCKF